MLTLKLKLSQILLAITKLTLNIPLHGSRYKFVTDSHITLDAALPYVLSFTPTKSEVDRTSGRQENRRRDRRADSDFFHELRSNVIPK